MKRMLCLVLSIGAAACRGTEPPPELLPRILEGECVRIALQTRAGDAEGVLVIDNLRARVSGGAGCGKIAQLEIGGWMDSNRNGRVDPGEGLEPMVHRPPGGPAEELTLEGLSLAIPAGNLKDLKLELSVYFTSGRTTQIQVAPR